MKNRLLYSQGESFPMNLTEEIGMSSDGGHGTTIKERFLVTVSCTLKFFIMISLYEYMMHELL